VLETQKNCQSDWRLYPDKVMSSCLCLFPCGGLHKWRNLIYNEIGFFSITEGQMQFHLLDEQRHDNGSHCYCLSLSLSLECYSISNQFIGNNPRGFWFIWSDLIWFHLTILTILSCILVHSENYCFLRTIQREHAVQREGKERVQNVVLQSLLRCRERST